MDRMREGEWQSGTVCDLSTWHVPCPAESQVALCPSPSDSLSTLSFSFFCLRQSSLPFRRCLLKLFLSLTRTTQTLLWHVLPLPLSHPHSCLLFFLFHCFWEQFTLLYLLLSYSFILAKPVGEPPSSLSLSILLVSRSPRGISDLLADLPLLHLRAGWLNFSFTFLQLSSNQCCRYCLKCKLSSNDWRVTLYDADQVLAFSNRDQVCFVTVMYHHFKICFHHLIWKRVHLSSLWRKIVKFCDV